MRNITRRSFLKWLGISTASLTLPVSTVVGFPQATSKPIVQPVLGEQEITFIEYGRAIEYDRFSGELLEVKPDEDIQALMLRQMEETMDLIPNMEYGPIRKLIPENVMLKFEAE